MAFGAVRGTLQGSGAAIAASNTATGSVALSVGDLIVLLVTEINTLTTATTASDNLGASYTIIRSGQGGAASNKTYYRYVTTPGTLTTITVLATASSNDFSITAAVFEGPFTSTPLDYNPGSLSSDTTSPFTNTLSTGTLSQADELVVMTMALNRGQTITTAVSPQIMAINVASSTGNSANSISACIGYQVVASTAAVNPSFACASGTFNGAAQLLCSFRKGASDTATGSATTTSTVTGTTRVDIARAGTSAAVTTGTTGSGSSDIARAGSASAVGTVSATGLATTVTYPLGLIARASVSTGSANSRTTPAIDTSGANLIFAHISHPPGISVSISDSYGNTWALDLLYDNKPSSPDVVSRLYKVGNNTPIVGPGHTFTFNGTGSNATIEFSAWRSGTTWTVGSIVVGKGALPHGTSGITTATAGDLVFALVSGNGTLTAPSQGTILHQVDTVASQNYATGHAYLIQPSSPNINISWSGTGEAGVINYTVHGTWLDANASDGTASATSSAAAGSDPNQVYWKDSGTRIVKSNASLDAYNPGTVFSLYSTVRASTSHTTGLWYCEIEFLSGVIDNPGFGVVDGTTAAGSGMDVSNPARSGGTRRNGFSFLNGFTAPGGDVLFGTISAGTRIGLAIDCDHQELYIANANVFPPDPETGASNPVTRTNPRIAWYSFPGSSIFPAAFIFDSKVRIHAHAATQLYAPPTGYTAWGDTSVILDTGVGSASALSTATAVGLATSVGNDTGVGSASATSTATGVSPSGDNVLWTPGSGSTIATDDIGGVHYQWMKPVFGVDGVVTDVTNADPLPLQGFAKTITSSVTRPANTTAYGTNTAWSNSTSSPTVLTFTNVGRLVGGAVLLNSVQAKVYPGTQDINAELWLFDSIPTAINDGSNFNVSDTELESLVCRVSFAFGGLDTSTIMVNAIGALINHTSGSNSLYGLIRMLRAYTPVSGSKLTFRLQVTQVD